MKTPLPISGEAVLRQLASTGRQCAAVQAAFDENPSPPVDTLIKLHRLLTFNLSAYGQANPGFQRLAGLLTETVIHFASTLSSNDFKERELKLKEHSVEEFLKDEQARALELCLAEAKAFPEVRQLFRQAMLMLEQAKRARLNSALSANAATPPKELD